MKKIIKNNEPKNLIEYRNKFSKEDIANNDIYSDYPYKTKENCAIDSNNLRKLLLQEQGYICCYCMSRISCDNSKIEHFKPQTKYKNLQLDYKNLFIACKGGEGNREQFCDTNKGDRELKKINLLENIENEITYKKSLNEIKITSNDRDIEDDISKLNLNAKLLKQNRKEKYDGVINKLKQKGFTKNDIRKTLDYFQNKNNDKYPEFCEMIVYFLKKKLKTQS